MAGWWRRFGGRWRVMIRTGRSILPATSQPARRASTATMRQSDSRVDQKLVRVRGTLGGLDGPGLGDLMYGLGELVHRRGS